MNLYHMPEVTRERMDTKLRAADAHRLVAEARASLAPDDPCGEARGPHFRIPLLRWELRLHPAR